jgi:ribosomal protein S17
MSTRNSRKTLTGFVTTRSGDKSVKVTIPYKTPHPRYHKVINRQTVLHVHDEKNETKAGDKVEVMETRPSAGSSAGASFASWNAPSFPMPWRSARPTSPPPSPPRPPRRSRPGRPEAGPSATAAD